MRDKPGKNMTDNEVFATQVDISATDVTPYRRTLLALPKENF